MHSLPGILSILGAIQGILLAVLLFTRKENPKANSALALFTLLFSLGLLERFLVPYRTNLLVALFSDMLGGTAFLYGPLVYLYVHRLLRGDWNRRLGLWHFSIFFAYVLLILVTIPFRESVQPDSKNEGLIEGGLILLLFAQIFFYCYQTLRLVFSAAKEEERIQAGVSVKWLKTILVSLTILYGSSFFATVLFMSGVAVNELLFIMVQVGCVALLYLLSYYALLQPQWIYAPLAKSENPKKYQGSALSGDDKQVLMQRILAYAEKEQPYLSPGLTIDKFADALEVNRYYVSQVINEQMGRNFSDFINWYRIEETKKLLQDPKHSHLKILAIGYAAGFNSKTTFNNAFKKWTGMSPSQYRKHLESIA